LRERGKIHPQSQVQTKKRRKGEPETTEPGLIWLKRFKKTAFLAPKGAEIAVCV